VDHRPRRRGDPLTAYLSPYLSPIFLGCRFPRCARRATVWLIASTFLGRYCGRHGRARLRELQRRRRP
jgi:hypothetical protein